MRQNSTIHSIQLLRSIAATLVVLFHAQQAFAQRVSTPLFQSETYLFGFGAVGVHIFFVISGFIMVLTSSQPRKPFDAPKFFKRRLLRIYPIYWICVVIYLVAHLLIGNPYIFSGGEFFRALLLWPSDAGLFIGPAWTLSYEMFFYICFGLAMMLSLTRGLIALGAAFFAATIAGHYIPDKSYTLFVVTNPLLIEFLAGAAIGWLAQMGWLPIRWGAAISLLGIGLFAGGIAFDYERWPSPVTWGIPSTILVLGLVTWERASGAGKWVRGLGRLGDSSYVLYLIHILVVTLATVFFQSQNFTPEPAVAALAIAAICIGIAEALHRWIEKPMLALFSPVRSLLPARKVEAPR